MTQDQPWRRAGGSVQIAGPTIAVLAALWIVTHPYGGIRHDGILYAAQAMLHQRPEVFRGDLFFAWGSQDDYTVFGRLYAMAVDALGLPFASKLLWAVSQSLWFIAALAWLRRFAPGRSLVVIGATVFAIPGWYGSDLVFRFAEPFVTARPFAEAFVLLALLYWCAERRIVGIALVSLAFLVHPLMALPGIATMLLLAVSTGRPMQWAGRHPIATLALASIVLGAAIGILAATGRLSRVDETWYGLLAARSTIVTLDHWGPLDWARAMLPVVALPIAAAAVDSRLRPLLLALAATAMSGLLIALLACLTRWELGLQAQFWRMTWPAHWAAPIAALAAAAGLPPAQRARRAMLLAFVPATLLTVQVWWDGGWALAVAWALFAVASHFGWLPERSDGRRVAAVLGCLLAGIALLDGILTGYVRMLLSDRSYAIESTLVALVVEKLGWLLLPLAVAAVGWRMRESPRIVSGRAGRAVLAAACVLASFPLADGRGPVRAGIEREIGQGLRSWRDAIPVDASVYWPHHVEHVWFVLGRRSYVSGAQLAGGVFSRDKAIEGDRRSSNVRALSDAEEVSMRIGQVRKPGPDSVTVAQLARACADPALGFVVLQKELGPTAGDPFVDEVTGRTHRLYRCSDYLAP